MGAALSLAGEEETDGRNLGGSFSQLKAEDYRILEKGLLFVLGLQPQARRFTSPNLFSHLRSGAYPGALWAALRMEEARV